jgi:hypothetical protein
MKATRSHISAVDGQKGKSARLTRELNDSLKRETATSEVLQVISSSPGDLEPVFTTMLENAVRICDAKFGNIYSWDGAPVKVVDETEADLRVRRPATLQGAGRLQVTYDCF